jgi:amino acid transporter
LYASPIVSSALITAFGLPTLVEYEAPKTTVATAATAVEEEEEQESKSPSFTRITSRRIRSQSLPLGEHIIDTTTTTAATSRRHTATTAATALYGDSRYNNRRLTKSANYSPNHHHSSNNTNNLHLNTVTSYTYRVRAPTISSNNYNNTNNTNNNITNNENGHHLLMVQNPDGTYSHANVHDGEPFVNDELLLMDHHHHDDGGRATTTTGNNDDGGDGGESGGLIQMTHHIEENIVPLTTITQLGEMLTDVTTTTSGSGGATTLNNNSNNEEKGNSNNVPLPPELLHPQYTSTTPALKLWPLAILVFYNVSGGPFGIEPSIRAAGNFYAILGFVVFPFVWSLPEALVTAELGSAFQDPSAGVAWVTDAFGEKMGCLCGYLGWVSGATDNAIYPTLFLEYVTSVMGLDKDEFSGWTRFGLVATISVSLSLLNYTGLEIVGKASLVVCVIAMSPFIIMTLIGAPQVVPSRWLQMPEVDPSPADGSNNNLFDDDFQTSPGPLPLLGFAGILWRPFMNNMFWNLNSFDSAASFAGETTDVKKTYPRGIFIGLVMTIVFYVVPLMVAVGATDYSQSEWVDGHLGAVAVDIGGSWLGAWTIFAAGISNLALFEAELSADAFQLMGMAERGYLPKIFQKRSRYGTPTTGIIVGTVVIILFGCADFGQLLELLNANYAISLLMEYAAFVKLRLFHKECKYTYVLVALLVIAFLVLFAQSFASPNANALLSPLLLLVYMIDSGTTLSYSTTRLGCSVACSTTISRYNSYHFDKQLVCVYLHLWCNHVWTIIFQVWRDCEATWLVHV